MFGERVARVGKTTKINVQREQHWMCCRAQFNPERRGDCENTDASSSQPSIEAHDELFYNNHQDDDDDEPHDAVENAVELHAVSERE